MTMPPREDDGGGRDSGIAPVIPLFGGAAPVEPAVAGPAWNATWADDAGGDDAHDGVDAEDDPGADEAGAEDGAAVEREIAERHLLRKLRTRSLSIREARVVVSDRDLTPDDVEAVLEDFVRRGYLDDKALAEQLVHSGVDRKGQGRQVIAQTLAKRGVPRDVADAVIAELPDDDADRALEFARTKARSMAGLDSETALRRLSGQLARRGYGGSTAFTAARAALGEVSRGSGGRASASKVTFRDS